MHVKMSIPTQYLWFFNHFKLNVFHMRTLGELNSWKSKCNKQPLSRLRIDHKIKAKWPMKFKSYFFFFFFFWLLLQRYLFEKKGNILTVLLHDLVNKHHIDRSDGPTIEISIFAEMKIKHGKYLQQLFDQLAHKSTITRINRFSMG